MVKLITYGGLGALVYAMYAGDVTGEDLMVAFYMAVDAVEFTLHLGEIAYEEVKTLWQ